MTFSSDLLERLGIHICREPWDSRRSSGTSWAPFGGTWGNGNWGTTAGFVSPFEEAVASELERRGWMVVPQVGISGFRIDLGVKHPDLAGIYLAGVERLTASSRARLDEALLHARGPKSDGEKV